MHADGGNFYRFQVAKKNDRALTAPGTFSHGATLPRRRANFIPLCSTKRATRGDISVPLELMKYDVRT